MAVKILNKLKFENCFVYINSGEFSSLEEVMEKNCFTLDCNLPHYHSILMHLSKKLAFFNEYIFILTRNVDNLPYKDKEKLSRTIVILIGDEWNRAPKYSDKVALVYKSPGQLNKLAFHKNAPKFNLLVLIQYLRIFYKKLFYPNKKNVISIPLCVYKLVDQTFKPINKRKYDISFLGSVIHTKKDCLMRKILKTPKILSRMKLFSLLNEMKSKYIVYEKPNDSFPNAYKDSSVDNYSEIMMDTKICVAPRGTNLETFRYFEGLYSGCVVIAEEQPDYGYLKDSPVITIKDWKDLPRIVDNLLNNEKLMEDLSKKGIEYYKNNCSPEALASQFEKDINEHYFTRQIFKMKELQSAIN